ncbi:uncharacterized protein [Typha latifolia]
MYEQEDTLSPEKSKRKQKTPAQIEALENLYKGHKYPSESMKLLFAKQIGLSEKQVSVWFCHRRLKDKKLMQGETHLKGKHNIINGYASGLVQESCSSTKQGETHFDPREVESKRSYGHNCSSVIVAHAQGGQYISNGCCTAVDDHFSGSSSTSYERMLQQNESPCYKEHLRSSFQNDNYTLMNSRAANSGRHMSDQRYSCLNVVDGSSTISFAKWKLGRHYREDGPPLGVIFDPLPPGAFDSPISVTHNGPYFVRDFEPRSPCSIRRVMSNCTVYHNCSNGVLSSNSHQKGSGLKRKLQGFHCLSDVARRHLNQKLSFPKSSNFASFQVEDFAEKASDYNRLEHHIYINSRIADSNKLYPHQSYNFNSLVSERKDLTGAKLMKQKSCYSLDADVNDIVLPKGLMKKKIISREGDLQLSSPVKPVMLGTNELKLDCKMNIFTLQGQEFGMISSQKHPESKPVICRTK